MTGNGVLGFSFDDAGRQHSGHLFHAYSLKAHAPINMYSKIQLAEWVRLEFDPFVIGLGVINKLFRIEGQVLFVPFLAEYMEGDYYIYVSGKEGAIEESFLEFCRSIGSHGRAITGLKLSAEKTEIWNKLKMISFIARWKDALTVANLTRFMSVVGARKECDVRAIKALEGFEGGLALACAFELVRIGRYSIPDLPREPVGDNTRFLLGEDSKR